MRSNINIIRNHKAFTLVEVLVSMTILAIVMVSILMIYALSVQVAMKADLNREMQQNIKSVVETLATDIRKNEIIGATSNSNTYGNYKKSIPLSASIGYKLMLADSRINAEKLEIDGNAPVISESIEYKLFLYNTSLGYSFKSVVSNIVECSEIKNICVIVKFHKGVELGPLTNSKISFTNLEFGVTQGAIPKVTINMSVRAAIKNGVRPDLIKGSVIHFQTTISERSLQVK